MSLFEQTGGALPPSEYDGSGNGALVSIAISLKRIADVLDGTAVGICVTETIFNPQTVQNREVRST